jgi:hypothetical protein
MLPQKEETPVVIDGNLSDDEGGVVDPVEAAQNE